MTAQILLVDDDNALRSAIAQGFELEGLPVKECERAETALKRVSKEYQGIIVSDVRMPGMDGLQFFEHIRQIDADLPVILITGHGEIPMAVAALKNGAYDFIEKPFAIERLIESVRRALEKRKLVLENRRLREAAIHQTEQSILIGQTPVMERLRNTIRHIADTDVDVLIAGETGSGKEVVATALHHWSSKRSQHTFVALNCGALPETVLDSELFGHEVGAFTGAQKKRIGRIEYSSGGTLFLDEIESMPLSVQVKMLRILEAREVAPLGTNDIRPVDLRVVAAAKVDLAEASKSGSFREDLFYRLNVVTLSIPPLRDRKADIELLFSHFLNKAAAKFDVDVPTINSSVSRYLKDHDWPGNVRELAHFAERVALGLHEVDSLGSVSSQRIGEQATSLSEKLDQEEAKIIRETLAQNQGDVARSIAALGIARKTFYDKLQRHNINRLEYTGK